MISIIYVEKIVRQIKPERTHKLIIVFYVMSADADEVLSAERRLQFFFIQRYSNEIELSKHIWHLKFQNYIAFATMQKM